MASLPGLTSPPCKILTFLTELRLESYYDTFIEAGYDDIDFLSVVPLEDLLEMGMKIGHARRVIGKINSELVTNPSTSTTTVETKSNENTSSTITPAAMNPADFPALPKKTSSKRNRNRNKKKSGTKKSPVVRICKNFKKDGTCRFGAECRFQHTAASNSTTPSNPSKNNNDKTSATKTVDPVNPGSSGPSVEKEGIENCTPNPKTSVDPVDPCTSGPSKSEEPKEESDEEVKLISCFEECMSNYVLTAEDIANRKRVESAEANMKLLSERFMSELLTGQVGTQSN